jgi:hypothetical protein
VTIPGRRSGPARTPGIGRRLAGANRAPGRRPADSGPGRPSRCAPGTSLVPCPQSPALRAAVRRAGRCRPGHPGSALPGRRPRRAGPPSRRCAVLARWGIETHRRYWAARSQAVVTVRRFGGQDGYLQSLHHAGASSRSADRGQQEVPLHQAGRRRLRRCGPEAEKLAAHRVLRGRKRSVEDNGRRRRRHGRLFDRRLQPRACRAVGAAPGVQRPGAHQLEASRCRAHGGGGRH